MGMCNFMCAQLTGCLRKWRARATLVPMPMPNPLRLTSSFTRPVLSMRPLWPKYRLICCAAHCAPSLAGVCWRVLRQKRCWATSTAIFSVDAGVCIQTHDRVALERLFRYRARPPFACERLRKEGTALVYRCAKQHSEPGSDKRSARVDEPHLTPLELITPIAALVPPQRTHRHRYFGVLAPNSPLRAAAVALATPAQPAKQVGVQAEPAATGAGVPGVVPLGYAISPTPAPAPPKRSPAHYLWAVLIARIYEVFRCCARCVVDRCA